MRMAHHSRSPLRGKGVAKVADRGRTWVEDDARCFLVMTAAEEIFELRLLTDGRWMLARAPERSHIA